MTANLVRSRTFLREEYCTSIRIQKKRTVENLKIIAGDAHACSLSLS